MSGSTPLPSVSSFSFLSASDRSSSGVRDSRLMLPMPVLVSALMFSRGGVPRRVRFPCGTLSNWGLGLMEVSGFILAGGRPRGFPDEGFLVGGSTSSTSSLSLSSTNFLPCWKEQGATCVWTTKRIKQGELVFASNRTKLWVSTTDEQQSYPPLHSVGAFHAAMWMDKMPRQEVALASHTDPNRRDAPNESGTVLISPLRPL